MSVLGNALVDGKLSARCAKKLHADVSWLREYLSKNELLPADEAKLLRDLDNSLTALVKHLFI